MSYYNIVGIRPDTDYGYNGEFDFYLDEPDDPEMSGIYLIRDNQILHFSNFRQAWLNYSTVFGSPFKIDSSIANHIDPDALSSFRQELSSLTLKPVVIAPQMSTRRRRN